MKLLDELLESLPAGSVREIRIGAFWTAVVAELNGQQRCGLASTLQVEENHHHGDSPAVRNAGSLLPGQVRELASLARSYHAIEAAIGMATINALLPWQEELWLDLNAEEALIRYGAGKRVALVGRFPFIPNLRKHVAILWVLERRSNGRDIPPEAVFEIIPRADVVAVTGTTLLNHTFEGLMALCRPDATVLVLGPSTPLSPIMFDYGVHLLSGAVVEDIEAVLRAVSQEANFRQVQRQGVRLVTMQKS